MIKTVYRLKRVPRALISEAWKTEDFSKVDAITDGNENILRDVYKRIQFGLSEYAYISSGDKKGGCIYCVSRDPQYSGAVRCSVFVRLGSGRDCRIYASSHKTFGTVKDFLRYSLPSGRLIVVGGWYDNLKRGCA